MTIAELILVLLTAATVSLSQPSPSAEAESDRDAVREAGLSKTQQEIIVSRHNRYRSEVSPPASNMVPLKWNDDLASKAQEWASECTLGHHDTPAQRATSDFASVGQNVAFGFGHGMNDFMDGMNEEKKDYDFNSNECSAVCTHYTQLVWATTTDIGCGWATCPKFGETFDYLVCNYGPRGNKEVVPPYTEGDPCTECPSGYGGGCKANLCTAS